MTTIRNAAATRRASDRAAGEARTRRFDDALRSARRAAGQKAAPSSPTPDAVAATIARRPAAERREGAPCDATRRDEGPEAARLPPHPTTPPPALAEASVPELRAALRTLPVTIDAARLRDGASLSLDLGQALSVEIRRRPAGLELLLRPEGSLSRATAAELPALVRALRARGLTVSRAEVRARSDGGSQLRGAAR